MSSIDQAKVQRIHESATELFARFGYRKTSISEIAEAAQVGKGTVYLVAKNKEELFFQVVSREVRAWVARIRTSAVDLPADKLLVQTSMSAFLYMEERPLVKDLLLGNLEEVLPLWTEQLEELREEGRAFTRGILKKGIDEGLFRRDLRVEETARVMQNMMAMGLLLAYRERKSLADQMAQAAITLDLLLNGLIVRA
jgi:AcrR family transcriptional regulator